MKKLRANVKGFVLGALAMLLFLSTGTGLASTFTRNETINVLYRDIRLVVNGQQVTPRDAQGNIVEPFIFNGTTFLPVRAVADALGENVHWDGPNSTVYVGQGPTSSTPPPPQPAPGTPGGGGSNQGNRPSNPSISLQRAIEIAYADLANRGIDATFHRDSGMDWERNQWVWELEFRPVGQRGVIEYYINVDTGAIVKFEWDR
jgi:hypothetical protein